MIIKNIKFNLKDLIENYPAIDTSTILHAPIVMNNTVVGAIYEYDNKNYDAKAWITCDINFFEEGTVASFELV